MMHETTTFRWFARMVSAAIAVALLLSGLGTATVHTVTARERATAKKVQVFDNPTQLGQGDDTPADSSIIEVSGFETLVADVEVTLFDVVWRPGSTQDLDVLLIGPEGRTSLLLSDVGGNTGTVNVTLVLDDQAPEQLPNNAALTAGRFQPTNFGDRDVIDFGEFEITPPSGAALGAFNGINPNGDWSLSVFDDEGNGNVGLINGWRLEITTANGVPQTAPDAFQAQAGQTLNVPANGVLANDRDPDGDVLSARGAGSPRKGTIDIRPDGSFSYRANKKAKGTDAFTYLARDPTGLTALETISIQIKGKKKKRRN